MVAAALPPDCVGRLPRPLLPLICKQIQIQHYLASPPCAMQSTCHPGLDQSSLTGPCSGTPSVPLCINAVGLKVRRPGRRSISMPDIKQLKLLCCRPASGPWRVCSVERALALAQGSMQHARRDKEHGCSQTPQAHVRCSASEPPPARHAPIRMRSPHVQNRGNMIAVVSCCVFLHTPSTIVRRRRS